MKKCDERHVKRLFMRAIMFFVLTIVIWIGACLLGGRELHYNPFLVAISIIPATFYIIYSYKLFTELNIEDFYLQLSRKKTDN